ncbi:WcaI family glycosyltransferase [Winogradskyella tangerina]|uniref:WcaI family glycosyltransferase n=1 Tax=Winogradskyella tangerina TaxID=2023240 RepID=UPI001E2ABC17|nr:WcaI family glycosyltransferase [Winogradskyella tangerina]
MKIALISPNYYPEDTAIGLYNADLVKYLLKHGCQINVITGFPYYPQWRINDNYRNKKRFLRENIDGIEVFRYKQYVPNNPTFLKRIIHILDFTFGSYFNLRKLKEADVIIAIVPFTSNIWLGNRLKRRHKAKLWVHVQDFEVDAAFQTGLGKKIKGIASLLFRLEKRLFSKADVVSTISQSMLAKLSDKTSVEQYYLPNWIDEDKIDPQQSKQHRYLKSSKLTILYSGNIGDKQDWSVFLKFCNDIDSEKYEVIVVGDGSKREWLADRIKELEHVSIYAPVPYDELSDLLCSADVHILFQKTEIIDSVMPSKVLGMMASAKPSIIIGNDKSEVKSIFEASKGGYYFSNYSNAVVGHLDKLTSLTKEEAKNRGDYCRNFVIDQFSKDKILSKMFSKLQEL